MNPDLDDLVAAGAAEAVGTLGTRRYHVTRCGPKVHVTWGARRPSCRCDTPEATGGICACDGSLWDCCGRADGEPHRDDCHTRASDGGVHVCAGNRWAR